MSAARFHSSYIVYSKEVVEFAFKGRMRAISEVILSLSPISVPQCVVVLRLSLLQEHFVV